MTHTSPFENSYMRSRRQSRQGGTRVSAVRPSGADWRRPLCRIGDVLDPDHFDARVLDGPDRVPRPDRGPFTMTSTLRTPWSAARPRLGRELHRGGSSLRPKPTLPATPRRVSLLVGEVMIVLLNDDLMCPPWAAFCALCARAGVRRRRLATNAAPMLINPGRASCPQPSSSDLQVRCACAARGPEGAMATLVTPDLILRLMSCVWQRRSPSTLTFWSM